MMRYPNRLSRRRLLRHGAVAGSAGAALTGFSSTLAGPAHRAATFARLQGLSGEITVSYADELGRKPPYVEQAAAAVMEANPEATVNIDHQQLPGGEFYTRLLLALDAGDSPDVIHVGGDRLGELAEAGYIAPLDDYVAEWEDWDQYPDAIKAGVTYNGSVWAIPYGLDTRFLYYRRDVFETVGLPADWEPANVEGILEAAVTIKEAAPDDVLVYALYAGEAGAGGTASHAFIPLLIAYGGSLQDENGLWIGQSPAIDQTFAYYERAWRTDEVVPTEILTTTSPWTAMREMMGNGGLALLFEGGWVYGGWVQDDEDGIDENIGYLLHPTVDAGPSFTIGGTGTVWYMGEASENKDLAWEFIKAFNSTEIVAQLNIEDPHPVARMDSAELPEFQANQFLVDSTESLQNAVFLPNDANFGRVVSAIQATTGLVASGETDAAGAAERYLQELQRAVGEENVSTAS